MGFCFVSRIFFLVRERASARRVVSRRSSSFVVVVLRRGARDVSFARRSRGGARARRSRESRPRVASGPVAGLNSKLSEVESDGAHRSSSRRPENLRVPRARSGGAGSAPGARDPLGTRTHPDGEAIAHACAGAWGRDPGRVAAHASATPTRGRVPESRRVGKTSERVDPGGTHQAVARVTFSALRRLGGGARGEVLPPTHRGVSGGRARAGRARRPRSSERRRRSELFLSFSVGQFVIQEIVQRVTESDFHESRGVYGS